MSVSQNVWRADFKCFSIGSAWYDERMEDRRPAAKGVERRRIFIIGMFDSIHFVRWLDIFRNEEIDFLLFPSSPHRKIHSGLEELLESPATASYRLSRWPSLSGLPLWLLDRVFLNRLRSLLAVREILSFKPHLMHAVELQNAGYLASLTYAKLKSSKPIFLATNYGSDIFWFSRFPRHAKRIRTLLSRLDRYAAECERDVRLAKTFGFRGQILPVQPNSGGFSEDILSSALLGPELRGTILVKGYHGWAGRAHLALFALESLQEELQNYEILIYSCNSSTKRLAMRIAKRSRLQIRTYRKGALSHEEMLSKFSRALVYIGLSRSDGISTSMLEAMALGAIPVQTSTACCDEWFEGSGVAIATLDTDEIAKGVRQAINLALNSDSASKNREIIRTKASRKEVSKNALTFYHL